MLDPARIREIEQKRMDALSAKHLHQWRRTVFNRLNFIVDLLALAVPAFYFPIRFLAKDTEIGPIVEVLWELLTAGLLVFAIVKQVGKWQERAEKHSRQIGENIFLAGQAEQLLISAESTSPDGAQWFLRFADSVEEIDRVALGEIKEEERKHAYREALKEFNPREKACCSECGASPWRYSPGSCQVCGNTPASTKATRKLKRR